MKTISLPSAAGPLSARRRRAQVPVLQHLAALVPSARHIFLPPHFSKTDKPKHFQTFGFKARRSLAGFALSLGSAATQQQPPFCALGDRYQPMACKGRRTRNGRC